MANLIYVPCFGATLFYTSKQSMVPVSFSRNRINSEESRQLQLHCACMVNMDVHGRALGVCVGVYGRAGDVGRNRAAPPEGGVPKGTQWTYALYCFIFDGL